MVETKFYRNKFYPQLLLEGRKGSWNAKKVLESIWDPFRWIIIAHIRDKVTSRTKLFNMHRSGKSTDVHKSYKRRKTAGNLTSVLKKTCSVSGLSDRHFQLECLSHFAVYPLEKIYSNISSCHQWRWLWLLSCAYLDEHLCQTDGLDKVVTLNTSYWHQALRKWNHFMENLPIEQNQQHSLK